MLTGLVGQLLPNGAVALTVPNGYVGTLAFNGDGIVFRAPGTITNHNTIRIANANETAPYTYMQVYNGAIPDGQTISVFTGKILSNRDSHYAFGGLMFSN